MSPGTVDFYTVSHKYESVNNFMRNDTKISRPRGRPRAFESDDVLARAGERFRTSGFAATSLDDLAAATGLNRPSLYSAFGDKRALYIAVIERLHARVSAAFDGLLAADLPLREMLERLFKATIAGYLTGVEGAAGCLVVSTAATAAVEDPEIRATLGRFLAMEDEKVAALLRQAGSPAPEAHGRVVAAMIHSLSTRARAGEPRETLIQAAKDCVDLVAGSAG